MCGKVKERRSRDVDTRATAATDVFFGVGVGEGGGGVDAGAGVATDDGGDAQNVKNTIYKDACFK